MDSLERITSLKELPSGKKIYFASDFHLGAPNSKESLVRERKIVEWLEHIKKDASAIFLVGDVFDFWFEYENVIPKGFIRFQGKLAELSDHGVPIFLFTGNHDLWYTDYFEKELSIQIFKNPIRAEIAGKDFFIGHGDGLGDGDHFFKFVKKIFVSRLPKWLFKWLHPDIGISIAKFWSGSSREGKGIEDEKFLGDDEILLNYCKQIEQKDHHDFYIFGHRHLALEMKVSNQSTYFNLGEWFKANTYLEFDGEKATLCHFNS